MSITIQFFLDSLKDRSDEDVIKILTDKIREKGFEVDCFYHPYTFKEKRGFRFDLKNSQDEKFLIGKLHDQTAFNNTKIWSPKTQYQSIIRLEEYLLHELLDEKVRKITDFIALDDQSGKLTFSRNREKSNELYLKIYDYSKHKEVYDQIDTKKQELGIVSIELDKRNKIGEISQTSLNPDEITTFLKQEDYDKVMEDLKQFMTEICTFLSTISSISINISNTDLNKIAEPMTKDNSEESESSDSSVQNSINSKPKLISRSQFIDSSNSKSTEVPEPIEKANSEEPEPSISSVENPVNSNLKLMPRPQLNDSSNSSSIEISEPIKKANSEESEPSSSSDEIPTESKVID